MGRSLLKNLGFRRHLFRNSFFRPKMPWDPFSLNFLAELVFLSKKRWKSFFCSFNPFWSPQVLFLVFRHAFGNRPAPGPGARKLTEVHGSSRKFWGRRGSARKFWGPLTEVTPPSARKLTEAHGSSRKFGWLPGPPPDPSPRPPQNSSNVGHFYRNSRKKRKIIQISRGQTSTKKFTEKQSRNVFPHDPNPVPVIQK